MSKGLARRLFGMFGGAMVGVTSFGGNLKAEATSATPITKDAPTELAEKTEYSIGTIDGFLHFRDLVNEGKVGGELKLKENGEVETDTRATITLTTSLDLTEGGEYTNGYCDKAIYKDGKVVGWREAKVDKEGKFTGWVEEPDPSAIDIANSDVTELKGDQTYVIKNQDGLTKFEKLKGANVKGISVVLLGDVENDAFVEPQNADDGKPVSWNEAVFNDDGAFQNWKKTGNGGGRYAPIGKYEEDENKNPITAKQFAAKFDGAGHEIKLTINVKGEHAGVFGYVNGGEICKLGIAAGSYISATGASSAGGIVGHAYWGATIISGCYNTGAVSGDSYAGGIAGDASGVVTITGCYNTGEVSGSNAGGIVGYSDWGATIISGCYNTGVVTATGVVGSAGGIAGNASGTISGCYNTGAVSGGDAGGIAGDAGGGATITGCYNTGAVKLSGGDSDSYVGGIAGEAFGASTISGCYNTGEISATDGGGHVGGIAGGDYGKIIGCYNTGAVSGGCGYGYAGGIAGWANGTIISGCYNTGEVSATGAANAGGIAGYANGEISGCYYLKKDENDPNSKGAKRGVGNNASYDDGTRCIAKTTLTDMQTAAFADELNAAIAKFEEGKEDEYKVRPEGGKVFVHVSGRTPELWWKVALDKEKAQAITAVDSIKAEVAKLSQLYEVSADEKLKSLDGIKVKIIPAATVEQVEERVKVAQGVLTGFRTKLQGAAVNIGHTRSSIGGDSGFYQAPNGVVTFKVTPNPGYKISEIITSGSRLIKPGSVVKTLPEWVKVGFKKV